MKFFKFIAILGVSFVAACAPKVSNWTQKENPKKNKVESVLTSHIVKYRAHEEHISKREKRELLQFLSTASPQPLQVTVYLDEFKGSSEKRVKDIKRIILKHGVPRDFVHINSQTKITKSEKKGEGSGVVVSVRRYYIIPPVCPDWSQSLAGRYSGDNSHMDSSNFGCADAVNFGMMVANPRDLVTGREAMTYDGKVMAEGVKRYHEDKVKELIDISSTSEIDTLGSESGSSSSGL